MYDVSTIIKTLRYEHKMTQQDLANKLGVSRGTVNLWESSNRSPKKETCQKICDLFQIDMQYLLGIVPNKNMKISEQEIDISLFEDGKLTDQNIMLPKTLLDEKGAYYAKHKKGSTCITIHNRESDEIVMVISKIG